MKGKLAYNMICKASFNSTILEAFHLKNLSFHRTINSFIMSLNSSATVELPRSFNKNDPIHRVL